MGDINIKPDRESASRSSLSTLNQPNSYQNFESFNDRKKSMHGQQERLKLDYLYNKQKFKKALKMSNNRLEKQKL